MLKDPELTVIEKTRVATVFAFHANTLNKMLTQKGEKNQFDDQNLGDYVRGIEPRIARRFRRDFRVWKSTYVEKVINDLEFAAQAYSGLRRRPKAFKELCAYPEVTRKLVQDPVFFAILMCGDGWLNKAPNHQKLLRDQSSRQVAVCGRGWGKSLVFSRKNLWLLFTKANVESLIISSTQRQSMIMFDYCYSTIMANPLMRDMLQRPGTTRTSFHWATPYPEVIAYATKASQAFSFDGMYVDKTGIGDAVVDELESIGIPEVKGVFFTDTEKENMLNYLKLLMEKNQLRIQGGDKQLIAQINEQQYEYLQPNTAQEHIHMKYRHPKGRHDDQLFALALACYATKESEPEQFVVAVPR